MARPLRIQYEGGLYHITLRGNERKAIVRDDEDHHRSVDAVGLSVFRHWVMLYLYRLMDNHAHLQSQVRKIASRLNLLLKS